MQNYKFEKKTTKPCLGYQASLGISKVLKRQYHMIHREIRNRKLVFLVMLLHLRIPLLTLSDQKLSHQNYTNTKRSFMTGSKD